MGNRCRMVLQSDWQSWKLIASSHPLAIHQYYIPQKVATSMPSQPLPHVLSWMCLDLLTLKKMTGTAHFTKIIPMLLIQVSELLLCGLHEHFLLWKFAKSVWFISFNIVWQQCKHGVMHMNLSKWCSQNYIYKRHKLTVGRFRHGRRSFYLTTWRTLNSDFSISTKHKNMSTDVYVSFLKKILRCIRFLTLSSFLTQIISFCSH